MVAKKYAHKIPFIVKINHNELLTYPNHYDQTLFASVDQAFDMGAVAVGATVYYGSTESRRQIEEISEAFLEVLKKFRSTLRSMNDIVAVRLQDEIEKRIQHTQGPSLS